MEQKLPMPNPSPEMGAYQRREALPVAPERVSPHEVQPQASSERREARQPQAPADIATLPALSAQPFLPPSDVGAPTKDDTQTDSSGPPAAADDDHIEKEWIDKAKKIVEETRDDPYNQEKEVSKLQADYIKKRYGKDIKLAS